MQLVERARALRSLSGLLEDAAAGNGRLALVCGEAGVGKTALLAEFLSGCGENVRVLAGACDPVVTPRPFGPLADIAADIGGELADLLSRGSPPGQMFDAVLRALGGGGRPSVVALEDLHWADQASLDLLCVLGRRVGGLRTLVIGTYRDDDLGDGHPLRVTLGHLASASAVRLPLSPLSEAGVAALVAGRRRDVRELYRLTGGNPFYVTELLAAEGADLPMTVRDAVLARVSRLSAEGRAALELVAAFGRPAGLDVLQRIGVGGAALDEAVSRGLLDWQQSRAGFRHELARSAVLGELSPARTATVHGQILRALRARTAGGDPAELAWHAEEAGDAAAVLEFAPEAARQAGRLGAHGEAAQQYARALRFAGALPAGMRADLAAASSREAALAGRVDDAAAAARMALELRRDLGDELGAGDTLASLAGLVWRTGKRAEALSLARQAVTVLERLPPGGELAAAYATLASLHGQAAEMADATTMARRALDLADRLGLPEVRIRALGTLGAAKLCGPAEDGWAELAEALDAATATRNEAETAAAYGRIVWFAAMHRQFGRLDRYFGDALAHCESRQLEGARLELQGSRCVELTHRGRWREADELARALLAEPGATLVDRIQPLYVLGRLRARRGDPDVWVPLEEALEISAPGNELQHIGNVRAVRAEAAWLEGDPVRMVAEAKSAYPLAVPVKDPWILGELSLWLWRGGALGAPEPVLAEHPYGLQIAGDWVGAAAGWERLGCPFEQAAALLDGDDEAALRQALHIFDELGAGPAVAMAARRLRALGAHGVPRGAQRATRADPHQLTRRQQEILALLGEELSDAEIAGRLYLSVRTVSHHVSAVLAKLGVRTRADAIARARQRAPSGARSGD